MERSDDPPWKKELDALEQDLYQRLRAIQSGKEAEELRVRMLGRKGPFQALMQQMRGLQPEERPAFGQYVNSARARCTTALEEAEVRLAEQELQKQLAEEWIDVTLPGVAPRLGGAHPIPELMHRIVSVLEGLGFSARLGPEVETEFYNFDALNMPETHPARDMQDTFYVQPGWLLRTHTSNTQVRVLQQETLPVRICCPGRVFRNEDVTSRSHLQFHQIELLYVDHGVTFCDLLSTLELFLKQLFGAMLPVRFRPSYFPFVEPGLEADIRCLLCQGKGCRVCKHTGWLEILGAGLVHPEVLRYGGVVEPDVTGFAAGMGIERLLMILRQVHDLRLFFENDLTFLGHGLPR